MGSKSNPIFKRLTKKQKESIEKRRRYNRKWAKENRDYFVKYYQDNKENYRESFLKYKETEKGQEAIQRYEQSEARRKAKTEWMKKARKEGRVA